MSVKRENTLVVDFNILPVRPDAARVHQFLEKEIKLQLKDVKNIQLHNIRNCVLIEVNDSETATRYQNLHNNKHLIYHEDKGFKIPVFVECEAVPVRVQDLPPAMKHTTVIDYLLKYGDVISITRERWKNFFPGVYNGVRILYMRIRRPIPSFATIGGFETSIVYPGQSKTCRQCHKATHPGKKCPQVPAAANGITNITQTPANSAPSGSETNSCFNTEDFPPIQSVPHQQPSAPPKQVTTVPTTADNQTASSSNDDDDGNENTSSETNKRRLSTRKANERKKICSDSASLNDSQIGVDNRTPGPTLRPRKAQT